MKIIFTTVFEMHQDNRIIHIKNFTDQNQSSFI